MSGGLALKFVPHVFKAPYLTGLEQALMVSRLTVIQWLKSSVETVSTSTPHLCAKSQNTILGNYSTFLL